MTVQRGNANSIMGTLGPLRKLGDFFDIISPRDIFLIQCEPAMLSRQKSSRGGSLDILAKSLANQDKI